jgi:peptide-methionine (S)-S-oxide reductase
MQRIRSHMLCICTYFFLFISCLDPVRESRNPMAAEPKTVAHEKVATFAEGCFWHTELVFESLVGVREVVSGYAGGTIEDPVYEQVSSGLTGHAEVVQVYYDPEKISFQTLVKAFFASHDPTSLNRQGQDEGTEYRSIAFYRNEEEKNIIWKEIKGLEKKYTHKIVTEVLPFKKFYPAEEFHQDYVSKNPDNSYVKYVCVPGFYDFKIKFKGVFKMDSLN